VVAGFGVVNVPLGPFPGAVNVTDTPLSGFPPESLTTVTSWLANRVLIGALCTDPLATVTENGTGAVLVSENVAGAATPCAVAVTL
jgi:hypothetical protein